MATFWISSPDVDINLMLEATDLDAAADFAGRLVDRGHVMGIPDSGRQRCTIVNWKMVRNVLVTADRPVNNKEAVWADHFDASHRALLAEEEEAKDDDA